MSQDLSVASSLLRELPGSIQSASTLAERRCEEQFHSTGDTALDAGIAGGLPVGRCHEICGEVSSGVTSFALRMLAGLTRRGHCVAWVESAGALDPVAGGSLGVRLDQLLWVRAPDELHALRAAEAILATPGFAQVVLDMRPSPGRNDTGKAQTAAQWVRLSRMAAGTRTSLVVLSGEGSLLRGVPAAVRLRLRKGQAVSSGVAPVLLEGIRTQLYVERAPAGACWTGRCLELALP